MKPHSCARKRNTREQAFTRLELLAVVLAMAIVGFVVFPALAQGRPRSQQAICLNNLRMLGQAILMFNIEHGQTDPWRLPLSGTGIENNAWYHFYLMTNELQTPKTLVCPSDSGRRLATDFSLSPNGGFLHPTYRNLSVSYFLGLDSFFALPNSVLSGDRNISGSAGSTCSSGLNPVWTLPFSKPAITWTKGIHDPSGNLLFHDGRVEQTSADGLKRAFTPWGEDNALTHLLLPSWPPLF